MHLLWHSITENVTYNYQSQLDFSLKCINNKFSLLVVILRLRSFLYKTTKLVLFIKPFKLAVLHIISEYFGEIRQGFVEQ